MNEREMGKALLRFDASLLAPADPRAEARRQVERVLASDRRWVRGLTALTIVAWLATVALVVAVLVIGDLMVYPKFHKLFQDAGGMKGGTAQQVLTAMTYVVAMGTTAVAGAVGALAVSALCTVLLLFTSRRATLRQVNARLLEISEQIKALKV